MAKVYRVGVLRRLANGFIRVPLRLGLTPRNVVLLTTRGRRTGKSRSTPVQLVEEGGERFLVAPYGPVAWVHNARAAGEVTLRRGRTSTTHTVSEVDSSEVAPILKRYMTKVPVTRPFFDASKDAPVAEFEAEAAHHPVFRLGPPK